MKKLLGIVVGIVCLMASAGMTQATEDGIIQSTEVPGPSQNSAARTSLIEAWNDNGAPGSTSTYSSPCFAFEYVPSISYLLERIDWYAGDVGGTVTVSVRDGDINGPTLGTVTYQEAPPRDWQGADLVPAVPVNAGASYFLVYSVVVGAQISAADQGDIIPHWHDSSGACTSWSGPWSSAPFRARFYGMVATPTEPGTWGSIKNVYR